MYKNELIERKNYFYPPFYKMINLTLKHRDPNKLDMMAADLADRMKVVFGSRVLGPEFPVVKRIQNSYLKVIRLKVERDASNKKSKSYCNKRLMISIVSLTINRSELSLMSIRYKNLRFIINFVYLSVQYIICH